MLWYKIFILILLVPYGHSIAEEYYDSKYIESPLVTAYDARRTPSTDKKQLDNLQNDVNTTVGIVNNKDDTKNNGTNLFQDAKGRNISEILREIINSGTTISNTTESAIENVTQFYHTDMKFYSPKLNLTFMQDYEYQYDEDSCGNANASGLIERNLNKTEINENVVTSSPSAYLTDFYNVRPAAAMPNLNITYKYENVQNVWYVPENYDCWQLPVLYGEMGQRQVTSGIFLVRDATLKNVVDLEKPVQSMTRTFLAPITYNTLNKWCSVEPCYGDHTLCLFPPDKISELCGSQYSVHTPTVSEQIALVNTVNSMRNRIASGVSKEYTHLPTAANMKQIIYDYDLEKMSKVWLHQCLPGPAPCSALNDDLVTQLECTKLSLHCCTNPQDNDVDTNCVPQDECFVPAIIGCIFEWFSSAGKNIDKIDVECGYSKYSSCNTVQIIWAITNKIGCAYGETSKGNVRVVCNFAPGAPFYLHTKYYCGFISHKNIASPDDDVTDSKFLSNYDLNMQPVVQPFNIMNNTRVINRTKARSMSNEWNLNVLYSVHQDAQLRRSLGDYLNGTKGLIVRLVTRYTFIEESEGRCDTNLPMYVIGDPGSLCIEKGRRFQALCYDFRDPTPGYRLVAVIAPIALFSLILYDLFSGVVRQTNY